MYESIFGLNNAKRACLCLQWKEAKTDLCMILPMLSGVGNVEQHNDANHRHREAASVCICLLCNHLVEDDLKGLGGDDEPAYVGIAQVSVEVLGLLI